jgi:diguanylate cyclase (GGDEF)-like protein
MLMIDIDDFKAYNDNYGHVQGDSCLRRVAEALASALPRAGDLVARYGGEEFAVLLPATDARGAQRVAERLLAAVRALGIPHAHSPVCPRITVSMGGATSGADGIDTPKALLLAADRALYAAKQRGKDRVCLGTTELPCPA